MWMALCIFLAATLISIFTIETDLEAQLDTTREGWWPDPDNEDKGLRENERPYVRGKHG